MFALMVRERDLIEQLDLSCVHEMSHRLRAADRCAARPGSDDCSRTPHVENGYGTTEAGPAVFGPHPDGLPTPPLSLGFPLASIGCSLVDGPSPDEGMLALRTPALMAGYLNLPEATASRMRDGWYLTGDVMRRDANGFYYFVGRADDMFVCGGENIYPGEVEKLLERHPDVAQAIVVPAPDDIKGQIPVAFIVPRSGRTRVSMRSSATRSSTGRPTRTHVSSNFRDQLPVSGTHKIDRTSLAAEAAALSRAAGRASRAEA